MVSSMMCMQPITGQHQSVCHVQTETVRTAAAVRLALSAQLWDHCSTSVNRDQ